MLSMPAELVDVNVHPAKTEIRFARESDVFDAVYRAVRAALATPGSGERRFFPRPDRAGTAGAPGPAAVRGPGCAPRPPRPRRKAFFDAVGRRIPRAARPDRPVPAKAVPGLNTAGIPDVIHLESAPVTAPETVLDIQPDPGETPAAQHPAGGACRPGSPARRAGPHTVRCAARCAERPASGPNAGARAAGRRTAARPCAPLPDPEQQTFRPAPASVPAAPCPGSVQNLHHHRARRRALFDRQARRARAHPVRQLSDTVRRCARAAAACAGAGQPVSAEEKQAVMDNLELLRDAGIEAEDYGGPTVVVRPRSRPTCRSTMCPICCSSWPTASKTAAMTRCAKRPSGCCTPSPAAPPSRRATGTGAQEMLALAQKILDGSVPPFCPHGRPCVLKITRKELEKQFGRLV